MTTLTDQVVLNADETARLLQQANGRCLHLICGRESITLHPDCKWPIPLIAQWRAENGECIDRIAYLEGQLA